MRVKKSKNELRIHIVDDDKLYNSFLSHLLSLNPDNIVESYLTGANLLKNLYKNPEIIILDYHLPDFNGSSLLQKISENNPEIAVVVVSGQEDISTAIKLLKEGAADYIVKNDDTKERLWMSISHLRDKISMREEIVELKNELKSQYDFSETIIGTHESMKSLYSLIDKACRSSISVSILGETGTGKEVAAKTIHYNSARKKAKFIAVNVASIPNELIESELFGHEKGSFTGAVARRIGRFEEANNGTLFLDEIAEMELTMQAKLLRVLQERELTRVGGNEVVKFDARIIIATHRDLAEEVKKGNFREDLYYRLLGLSIQLPPLRERGSDIVLLAKHFIKMNCAANNLSLFKITAEAQNKLMDYHFPGNIRELKSMIDLACVMSNNDTIDAENIKFGKSASSSDFLLKEMTLDEYNKKLIATYLEKYNNNVLLVAKKLNIGKSTIYRMLKDN